MADNPLAQKPRADERRHDEKGYKDLGGHATAPLCIGKSRAEASLSHRKARERSGDGGCIAGFGALAINA